MILLFGADGQFGQEMAGQAKLAGGQVVTVGRRQADITDGRRPRIKAIATADFPTEAKRPQNSVPDSSRFAATFGFSAEPSHEAIDRTVREFFVGVER